MMKVEKNKIVFAAVLAVIFIFLISYSVMVLGDDDDDTENLKHYDLYPHQAPSINQSKN